MRRLLLLAAAALVPLAVAAAIATAPAGKVVDLDNYNAEAVPPTSYINAAQCAGTAPLNLEWSIIDVNGGLVGPGEYRLFASNTAPPTTDSTGRTANFCDEDDIEQTGAPSIFAGRIGVVQWTSDIQGLEVPGTAAATEANVACDESGESETIFICAHLYEGASTRKGFASGQFVVQVRAPEPPTGVSAGPAGETSLLVRWTPPTSGVEVSEFAAAATPVGGGAEIRSGRTEGNEVTISNLTPGVTYDVVVFAYSLGGNESAPSASAQASPAPVDDFFEWYQRQGGLDDGGCASGPAGPLALLAVGFALLLRRRP